MKETRFNRKVEKEIYGEAKHNVEELLTYAINKRRAKFSKKDHIKLLIFASLMHVFAEGASKSLRKKTPSADTLLKYIKTQTKEQLREAFELQMKENVNRLKRQRELWKPVRIAIDWTAEMFYRDHEKTPMVNGTKHENGSNYAFQFLTICVLVDGERLVVGVLPLQSKYELPGHTLRAIERVRELGDKIRDVAIDAGFFSTEMISCLQKEFEEKTLLKYVIRMPINRKAKKMRFWDGRRFTYKLEDKSKIYSRYIQSGFQYTL